MQPIIPNPHSLDYADSKGKGVEQKQNYEFYSNEFLVSFSFPLMTFTFTANNTSHLYTIIATFIVSQYQSPSLMPKRIFSNI